MSTAPIGSPPGAPRAAHRGGVGAASALVTPGSVAPVGSRVLAYLLDVVVVVAAAGLGYAVAAATSAPRTALLLAAAAAGVAVAVGQWVAEARTGATLGSAVVGIRTVSTSTGRPAGLRAILVRQLVVGVGALACVVGQWVVVSSGTWDATPAQRGWHDKAAGTLVLRARAVRRPVAGSGARPAGRVVPPAASGSRVVQLPPSVEAPAAGATVSAGLVRSAPDGGAGAAPPRSAGPVITGMPGVDTRRRRSDPPTVVPLIDVPSVPAVVVPSRVERAPGLLAGPRPDRTGAPLVRPADPGIGELERLADAPVVRPADPGLDDPEGEPGPVPTDPGLGALEHTRLRPAVPAPATSTRLHLRFDTGEEVDVTGDGLVGRSPAVEPGIQHVVSIDDPDRSISKVHLAFGPEPDGRRLWVVDRGSTNGTVLVGPDGASVALHPGTRAVVEPGWTVRFGRRSLRVVDEA
ncbi:FHA domain-containing protein [Cellulomonas humilata]|uniref:FHA domain-containing protein n=1 Tax=Cellulomonas humilata TaxID=144055 RepID=A0A7Y6DYH6_9CELL|nr:RDD family protein [Cellulomonas humilata]NUU18009.1 FHA domain-containing protein [Cellulomonas humilata]